MILCFGSLFLIVVGLLGIFAKDFIWDLTEWQNKLLGINSEKTDHWDTITTVSGVFLLLLGLWALYIFFSNGF